MAELEFFHAIAASDLAAIRGCVEKEPALLDSFNYRSFGATPLTMACFSLQRSVIELLIELGADPNKRSDWNMGPWSPLHCVIYRGDKALARYLLEHGATLDVHTAAGLGDCQRSRACWMPSRVACPSRVETVVSHCTLRTQLR